MGAFDDKAPERIGYRQVNQPAAAFQNFPTASAQASRAEQTVQAFGEISFRLKQANERMHGHLDVLFGTTPTALTKCRDAGVQPSLNDVMEELLQEVDRSEQLAARLG